ncbi:hypothetical protein ACLOJK_004613 [Asimina triloba]
MNKKEYKTYFSLSTRRAVTVLDLLPLLLAVKASCRDLLRGMRWCVSDEERPCDNCIVRGVSPLALRLGWVFGFYFPRGSEMSDLLRCHR